LPLVACSGALNPSYFLVLYALIGTLVTTLVFGKPLVRLNFEQLKEADFRFSLVRIKTQKRSPLPGRRGESNQVKQRFLEAFDNVKRLSGN